MALQLGALREALLHPGDPDLAAKAAEEVAGYTRRHSTLDTPLRVLTAMVAVLIALVLFVLGTVWSR